MKVKGRSGAAPEKNHHRDRLPLRRGEAPLAPQRRKDGAVSLLKTKIHRRDAENGEGRRGKKGPL